MSQSREHKSSKRMWFPNGPCLDRHPAFYHSPLLPRMPWIKNIHGCQLRQQSLHRLFPELIKWIEPTSQWDSAWVQRSKSLTRYCKKVEDEHIVCDSLQILQARLLCTTPYCQVGPSHPLWWLHKKESEPYYVSSKRLSAGLMCLLAGSS